MQLRHPIRTIATAILLSLSTAATAGTVDYATGGGTLFHFDAPDGWEVVKGFEVSAAEMPEGTPPAPRVVSLLPPEETRIMWTGLWSPPEVGTFAEARDYLGKAVPRLLADPEVTYRDTRTVGGREARVWSGVGTRGPRDMDFSIAAIRIAAGRIVLAAFIGEPEAWDRHQAELTAVLNSIAPGAAR